MTLRWELTQRQWAFVEAKETEVLYGGAAGGGKTHAQVADMYLFAQRYPGSKQLMLRRSFPELDRSVIRLALELYPAADFRYNGSSHTGLFSNGSLIDFGYCDGLGDVGRYQSAEYDVIRFDELTHFEGSVYTYLLSRVRGANGYPKQVKSTSNPGGVGHKFVKERFILPAPPQTGFQAAHGTRIYLPARAVENPFLMRADPGYLERLENLDPLEKRRLLDGDWDADAGNYFGEFRREKHVVEPFSLPGNWRVYRSLDYGLDMLACLWIAMDGAGNAVVFREACKPNLVITEAADWILRSGQESVIQTFAPPDLWNRRQETGKSVQQLFLEKGLPLTKAQNGRVAGWLHVKEALRGEGRLRIFKTCTHLIESLGGLQVDARDPNDCAEEPHELTHAADALRYFFAGRPVYASAVRRETDRSFLEYGG